MTFGETEEDIGRFLPLEHSDSYRRMVDRLHAREREDESARQAEVTSPDGGMVLSLPPKKE